MYDLIAAELFGQPHLVTASRLDALAAYVMSRQGYRINVPEQPEPQAFMVPDTAVRSDNGYYIDHGVAIIDMVGTMVHRGGPMQALSGITSYNAIGRRLDRAIADPGVNAILLNTDSPGGAVSGAFDLADAVHLARAEKPIETLACDHMASAAYLIGCGADRVHTTQTGQIGSIGVVMKHMDWSKSNEQIGLTPSYIYAGDHKIDGNPDQPLPDDVRAHFQAQIDRLYGMFVSAVAMRRGIDESAIIDTQAGVYMGSDAVDIGLADSVTNGEELLESMRTRYGAASRHTVFTPTMTQQEESTMSVNNKQPQPAATPEAATATAAEQSQAVDVDAIRAEARAEGRSEERTRISAILNCEAASQRMQSALHVATATDMSAEDAQAFLEKLPAEAKGGSTPLEQAMANTEQPNIGAEAEANDDTPAHLSIVHNYRQATGRK